MYISLSKFRYKRKPHDKVAGLINNSLHKKNITIEELANAIREGCTFAPALFKNDNRCNENFIKASMVVLDIDKSPIPLDKAVENFSYTIAYPTFSNGTIKNKYSYRILVQLDNEISSLEEYFYYATILSELLKEQSNITVDNTCLQGSRMYYGTNGGVTMTTSDFDYSKQYLTSWWNENHNTIIPYNPVVLKTDCKYKQGYIYSLVKRGVSDCDIVRAGRIMGYILISSSKQMIDWQENEEVRVESNHIEIRRQWRIDENGKMMPRRCGVGEDRRIRFLKMLSIKKQIKPDITYDELLYNAVCERFYFYNNIDEKLSNKWILSIIPSVLRKTYQFETTTKFSCNMPLIKANGKSHQAVIAEKKHQLLVDAIMSLYNPSFTILQNLDAMQQNGLQISLSTLKRILKEKGITKNRKMKKGGSLLKE